MRTIYTITALMFGACGSLASADTGWALHGFGDVGVMNDYITPRGLVVTTRGSTIHVLDGLVAIAPNGIAFHAGTWTDLNPGFSRRDGNISAVNEFDYFFGVSGNIAKKLEAGVEYSQFISGQPSVAFKTERNIEFSLKYKDGGKTLSINPYAKLFWAVSGKSSTVVLGKAGGTFDVELGAVPTWSLDKVTLSMPSWITVGPKTYWGTGPNRDGNVGVVTTGLKASVPIAFVKGSANASLYAFGQYYHLVNDALLKSKSILNSGDHSRDNVVFGGGVSIGF